MSRSSTSKCNLKNNLSQKIGWSCWWCGIPLDERVGSARATLDHRIPKSKGGSDSKDNYYLACDFCNHARQSKSPAEFLMYLDHLRQHQLVSVIRPDGKVDFSLRHENF